MTSYSGQARIQGKGRRVTIRPLEDGDLAIMGPWYPEAVEAVQGIVPEVETLAEHRRRVAAAEGCLLAIVTTGERPVGLLEYRIDLPAEGCLAIPFLAVVPERRGHGLGDESVLLLEGAAQRQGLARSFAAPVPLTNGWALYFWLRLGYSPLRGDMKGSDWPAGYTWMIRNREGG